MNGTSRTARGCVELPDALDRKLPSASPEWTWQSVFRAALCHIDRSRNQIRRHRFPETAVQKAVRLTALDAGIAKRVTSHALRHSFATHLIEDGRDIRTVHERLGHKYVATMIYTHVLNLGPAGMRSLRDGM